jgi:hypothetical protein
MDSKLVSHELLYELIQLRDQKYDGLQPQMDPHSDDPRLHELVVQHRRRVIAGGIQKLVQPLPCSIVDACIGRTATMATPLPATNSDCPDVRRTLTLPSNMPQDARTRAASCGWMPHAEADSQFVPSTYSFSKPRYFSIDRTACTCNAIKPKFCAVQRSPKR